MGETRRERTARPPAHLTHVPCLPALLVQIRRRSTQRPRRVESVTAVGNAGHSPLRGARAQVDAYAASRLPCTYAALKYAFNQVRMCAGERDGWTDAGIPHLKPAPPCQLAVRAPSFAPRSMLDFGSGPGTASWAAASLWPGACTHLVGVEPSPGMRALADALQASCAAPVDPGAAVPPPCRHVAALERLRGPEQQRRYDLVVAAYALGELPSRAAQQAAVRRLWAHTRDVLVIVEPGTPKAAALVRTARQDVLDSAARAGRTRAKAAQRSLAASIDASPGGGDGEGEDPSVHVVAPCAHEHRCPMEDSSSWCHFVQRVQRTAAQRLSKGGANIWSHQDERFSYAILRRGPRPQAAPRLLAPPGSAPEHADAGSTAMAEASALAAAGWPRVVRPPRRRTRHVVLDLCTPAGELEQRTVAASHHAALGEGSTELLRGLRWGDCWPHPPAK